MNYWNPHEVFADELPASIRKPLLTLHICAQQFVERVRSGEGELVAHSIRNLCDELETAIRHEYKQPLIKDRQ
jgi:hypothetical protein